MKCTAYCLLASLILSPFSQAGTLQFSAQVQDEALAEESVHLLHCLAERSGDHWEFSGNAAGDHWLKVTETGRRLQVRYLRSGAETQLELVPGEADNACDRLAPAAEMAKAPLSEGFGTIALPTPTERKTKYWTWAAVFAGAAVASYLVWKSRQPDHRSLVMN